MKIFNKNWPIISIIGSGLLIIFFFTEHKIYSDALQRFAAIKLLMEYGKISNTNYSIIGPLFSVPFWLIGEYIKTPEWWLARYNFFLFMGFLLGVWFICKNSIDRKTLLYALLVFVSLSLFVPYQKNYMGETFTAVFCGLGILLRSQKKTNWLVATYYRNSKYTSNISWI